MRHTFRPLAAAACLLLAAPAVRAQLLEDIGVAAEGAHAAVTIRMNGQIQYLRHHPLKDGRLVQIEFQLLTPDTRLSSPVEEFLKLPASELAPEVTVEYPPQSTALIKRLTVRFGSPVSYRILPGNGNRALRILIPLKDRQGAAGERDGARAESRRYAIALETIPADGRQSRPIPSQLQDHPVQMRKAERDGRPATELLLGEFASEAEAEKVLAVAAKTFPRAGIVRLDEAPVHAVAAAAEPRAEPAPSKQAPAPAAPEPAGPAPAPAIQSAEEVERQAAGLLAQGRAALERGENDAAIEAFNRLLILPPTRQSQEAQELAGLARERNGELTKARAEYELYLKLYPDGEGASRVRQRLAALGTEKQTAAAERARATPRGRPAEFTTAGSFSQYYYRGATRAETLVANGTTIDKATFSGIDQSALVTNIDLVGRYRSSEYDNRLVFRDTDTRSFIRNGRSLNRLTAAYFDFRNLQQNFNGRLGRQSATGGGVLGRFDGGLVGYGLSPQWRLNAVAGRPVDYFLDSQRYFYGLSVDLATFADHWSGSAFAINQEIDGITDRRAVGGEVRYFDAQRSAYALLDYDVHYRRLNIGMLQGTWVTESGLSWNLLADYRMTPSLQSANALIGEPSSSMHRLLGTVSESRVREMALDRTAVARLLFFGVSKPVNTTWQIGADFRFSNIGALPAMESSTGMLIPASPATGNVYNVNLQAIGTGLLAQRDITAFNAGVITGPSYRGRSFAINNLSVLQEKWILEPSLRMYWQHDTLDNDLRRLSPGLRVSYRWREKVAFEFEGALEHTRVSGPTQNEHTLRKFFSIGYRIDI